MTWATSDKGSSWSLLLPSNPLGLQVGPEYLLYNIPIHFYPLVGLERETRIYFLPQSPCHDT